MKIFVFCFFLSISCFAQQNQVEQIAANCSAKQLKENLYQIASPQMEGRMFATHGDTLVSNYVAGWFKKHGLIAPYQNGASYFQAVTGSQIHDQVSLTIGNKQYTELDGWQLYPNKKFNTPLVTVLVAAHQNISDFDNDLPKMNLKDKAVLLSAKLFVPLLISNRIDSLEKEMKKRGALMVIWGGKQVNKAIERRSARLFLPNYIIDPKVSPGPANVIMPEVGLTPERFGELLATNHITVKEDESFTMPGGQLFTDLNAKIKVSFKRTLKEVKGPNVIGMVKGTDAAAPCIVVTAHHDHDGTNGTAIYYGAVDNGSGTVALMQMAAMMQEAVKKGIRPKRTVIFASFTGEERGLLGSMWYVSNPVIPLKQTYAMVNTDMLGRVDTIYNNHKKPDSLNYVYMQVKDAANVGLNKAVEEANNQVKLVLDRHYEDPRYEKRMLLGSDHYPFYLNGIPFIDFNCGFCTDYHEPTDTPNKINYDLLKKQTQLAFLTVWKLAN